MQWLSPQSASWSVPNCVRSLLLVVDTRGCTAKQPSMDLAISYPDAGDVRNFIWLPASFQDSEWQHEPKAWQGLFILSTVVLACKNRLGRGEAEKNCRSASRGKSKKRVSWVLRTWAECSLQTSTRSIQCSWQKDSRPKPVVLGDLSDQELNPIGKWNKELQARALVNGCLKQLRSLICPKAVREDPEAW